MDIENSKQSRDDSLLTVAQAARILNISVSTLKKFIYEGKVKTFKTPGGHHRIRKNDLFLMMSGEPEALPSASDNLTQEILLEISRGFVKLAEKRQRFGQGHAESVARLCVKIAERFGFSESRKDELFLSALLHDIGKVSVDESILNKPASLTPDEYAIVKTHPVAGEEIASTIRQLGKAAKVIRQHHERFDGSGYPDGLKGEDISLEARIISVADAYNSMTSNGFYRKLFSEQEALEEIKAHTSSQFDPLVSEAFFKLNGSK